jgi:hypothetical protein
MPVSKKRDMEDQLAHLLGIDAASGQGVQPAVPGFPAVFSSVYCCVCVVCVVGCVVVVCFALLKISLGTLSRFLITSKHRDPECVVPLSGL